MSTFKQHGLVILGYLVVVVAMSWPVPWHLQDQIAGEGGDPWQTMWRFEEQEDRITKLEFWTDFFGGGEPRLVNYSTLPWMPLHLLLGQPLAYNIIWLLSFILSGYFMYCLVFHLLDTNLKIEKWNLKIQAAFLSGVMYMLLPYHIAHGMGHFGAMQTQWLPLSFLLLLRFVEQPRWGRMIGLVAALILQALSEHHYFVWFVIAAVIYLFFERRQARGVLACEHWATLVCGVGLFLLLVVVPYWPTILLAAIPDSLLVLGVDQTVRFSADILSYVVPASFHPLWGGLAHALFRHRFTGNMAESTHYVGVSILLLIIFFRQKIPKRQLAVWVTLALTFWVISLGPQLHVMGRVLAIPLPYALIDSLPVFSAVRAVGRAGVMVGLSLAVLFGWVVATQVRRSWVAGVLAGLILLEFLFLPVPLQSAGLSPAYALIRDVPGTAILELPAATNYTLSSKALYASLVHGKDVVGSIALERAETGETAMESRSLPALRHLLYLRTGQLRIDRPDFFNQALPETVADTLAWLDVGAILVHQDSLSTLQLAAVRNFLEEDMNLTAQVFDDALLYEVPQALKEKGDGIFLARDSRWENVGFDEDRGSTFAEIPREAGIALYNRLDVPVQVRLSFTIAPESHGFILFESETSRQELALDGGEVGEVTVDLPARSKTTYVFRNQLTEKVIIQDPSLRVTGTSL